MAKQKISTVLRTIKRHSQSALIVRLLSFLIICLGLITAQAQQTAFTYQGKLTDGGSAANGNYDLQFALFDSPTDGTQISSTQTLASVSVSAGIFTVSLDFGANAFNGASRYLAIGARPSGGGSFITLSPRQPITSTPYAVRSVSAATADGLSLSCVSCVTSAQIQSVQGSQVTGAVPGGQINGTIPVASVPSGSESYIQNGTAQQASSNFNISGNGTAGGTLSGNAVSATTRFDLGGLPVLRLTGKSNTLDGLSLGTWATSQGAGNTVIGWEAGTLFPDSNDNTFLGKQSGFPNVSHGSSNTLLGAYTKFSDSVSNATAIGANASVERSNSLVLGNGVNVGIGTNAPQFKLQVTDPSNKGLRAETGSAGGTVASFGGFGEFQIDAPGNPGGRLNIKENGSVVLGDCPGCFPNPTDRLVVSGTTRLLSLGSGGSASLCRNGSGQISACSSSIRYKNNIANFSSGLSLLNRLRPVTFDWKDSQAPDLGLVAEEVAEAEPLLVTRNEKGEVEGVKYDRLSAVFINAFKEQQAQMERQQAEAKSQQNQIAFLRAANDGLNARLRTIEKTLKKHSATRRNHSPR
ncbi:MAG TPA: tail fiber domain-containing protein [Pyrinomonadaceae bacterium]|nr:tail fiber domain-containing protein [Pyrinomonadaceae bacterium]